MHSGEINRPPSFGDSFLAQGAFTNAPGVPHTCGTLEHPEAENDEADHPGDD
jgi:hypothetical protein